MMMIYDGLLETQGRSNHSTNKSKEEAQKRNCLHYSLNVMNENGRLVGFRCDAVIAYVMLDLLTQHPALAVTPSFYFSVKKCFD
jgi:hypothetical protein